MIPAKYSIKWREAENGSHLACWIGPTMETEPTDEWKILMQVSLRMVEEDEELFPALVEVVNDWTVRFFEKQGVTVDKMVHFPGGFVPPGEQN
jgi:hypothetical protein